jgi:hypothetical protein
MDYANHLLLQIEMLRTDISHEELSKRLGDPTERCLARYIAGKTHLQKQDLARLAEALRIAPEMLARAWSRSLGQRLPEKDGVGYMIELAYRDWRRSARVYGVPPHPSPMTIIRVKYAHQLSRQTPLLWFGKAGNRGKDTSEGRKCFARAYEMLVEFVHENRSQRDIGAMRGLSGERARQLMQCAAYTWARSEGLNLAGDMSVAFKYEARLVKNLYAGLRFVAQYSVAELSVAQE